MELYMEMINEVLGRFNEIIALNLPLLEVKGFAYLNAVPKFLAETMTDFAESAINWIMTDPYAIRFLLVTFVFAKGLQIMAKMVLRGIRYTSGYHYLRRKLYNFNRRFHTIPTPTFGCKHEL